MKNEGFNIKKKLITRYLIKDEVKEATKSTDINVLLNRVKNNQKNETKKKVMFSAIASTGLLLFGIIIF